MAIAEALQGKYLDAFKLLAARYNEVQSVTGAPRGKYETEMGIMLGRLGKPLGALNHFTLAYGNHFSAGRLDLCAGVDTARARTLVTLGEAAKALKYLGRAEAAATKFRDYRLLVHVSETKAEAYRALVELG